MVYECVLGVNVRRKRVHELELARILNFRHANPGHSTIRENSRRVMPVRNLLARGICSRIWGNLCVALEKFQVLLHYYSGSSVLANDCPVRRNNMSRFPIAPGEVCIRPYQPEDADALFAAVKESMADIQPWMPWCHSDYSIEDARSWIEATVAGHANGTFYDFAIITGGEFVGSCGINNINTMDRVANLGYWLRTSCTGQGIATSAVRQLLRWALDNTNLNRVEIVVAVDNHKSRRVAELVGAHRDAVLPMRTMVGNRPSDAIMYSVLREAHD